MLDLYSKQIACFETGVSQTERFDDVMASLRLFLFLSVQICIDANEKYFKFLC